MMMAMTPSLVSNLCVKCARFWAEVVEENIRESGTDIISDKTFSTHNICLSNIGSASTMQKNIILSMGR